MLNHEMILTEVEKTVLILAMLDDDIPDPHDNHGTGQTMETGD